MKWNERVYKCILHVAPFTDIMALGLNIVLRIHSHSLNIAPVEYYRDSPALLSWGFHGARLFPRLFLPRNWSGNPEEKAYQEGPCCGSKSWLYSPKRPCRSFHWSPSWSSARLPGTAVGFQPSGLWGIPGSTPGVENLGGFLSSSWKIEHRW